jgi:hypothetical protein
MGLSFGVQPSWRLVANDADITAAMQERFINLRMTDETGYLSDTAEVRLADNNLLNPIIIPPTGAELRLYLGYDGQSQDMGLFVCDEWEAGGWPGYLVIRGRAAIYEKTPAGKVSLTTQKSRTWKNGMTINQVVTQIAGEHGMKPGVAKSLASVALHEYHQSDESDLNFLLRLAKVYDAIVKPAGGVLMFLKRGESLTTSGVAIPKVTISVEQVARWRVEHTRKENAGSVVAYWHEKRAGKRHEVTVGSGDPVHRIKHYFKTQDAAQASVKAEYDKRKRGGKRLHLVCQGSPLLMAEGVLVLDSFRAGLPTEWLITRVEHTLANQGYVCEVEAELPGDTDSTVQ